FTNISGGKATNSLDETYGLQPTQYRDGIQRTNNGRDYDFHHTPLTVFYTQI
ncbi:495_t:CDS:2, partial [Cetraspora pellucida]